MCVYVCASDSQAVRCSWHSPTWHLTQKSDPVSAALAALPGRCPFLFRSCFVLAAGRKVKGMVSHAGLISQLWTGTLLPLCLSFLIHKAGAKSSPGAPLDCEALGQAASRVWHRQPAAG